MLRSERWMEPRDWARQCIQKHCSAVIHLCRGFLHLMTGQFKFAVLVLAFALTGCWQAAVDIYSAEDFFVPFQGDIISLSDDYGPLGLYQVDAQNRYVPIYTDAPAISPESDYRSSRFGLVALDQALAWPTKRDSWRKDRSISSQEYPDEDKLLLIAVASTPGGVGQALTVATLSGNTFSRCSRAIYDKSPQYNAFLKLQGNDGVISDVEKTYATVLVHNEIIRARKQGVFRCTELAVKTHPRSAKAKLIQAAKSGDGRREIARQHERDERELAAARKAERSAKEQNSVYDPDGYYLVTPGGLTRLKRGKDRNYRATYDAYLEVNSGQFPRPFRQGDLVGRASLYRDTQQFSYRPYTFTSNRRCGSFTDAFYFGQFTPVEDGVWKESYQWPADRQQSDNACIAYEVRVNSCARVYCSVRLKNAPRTGARYLVEERKKAYALLDQLR